MREIDFEKCATALKHLGFRGVESYDIFTIRFDATRTMLNFIDRFDDEDFPELILK